MVKAVGYSGVELPVDEAVYDDNRFLLDKKQIDANFKAGMYKGLDLEQQNNLREYVGLPLLTEDTQNPMHLTVRS
ncbi:hypothetical protein [Collimonas sp.]|jgi:hypothetical protein|uniref:hypothetical protein n=1 Tax=Collimonas sp. TaxID=1963772 RepID=UPI002BD65D57|nr:hypothetical protein [Collimonas sp.]HWW08144.1 hypothetical protein [Collimonas sp.]